MRIISIFWARRSIHSGLNVLFFGSDEFSIHSLRALQDISLRRDGIIGKVQVVTKPGKWCGRGNAILKYPPITDVVSTLGMDPPITCDSKQDMLEKLVPLVTREQFNMLVAVSFGKLIPSKLINSVPYSLNVHPSLLPRYKGSAPIQHTLLNGDDVTGVTIQTLHPSKFDHGAIVAQTEELSVPALLLKKTTIKSMPRNTAILMDQLGIIGADLLSKVIMNGSYKRTLPESGKYKSSLAPRIKTEDKAIDWEKDTSEALVTKFNTLGPMYTFKEIEVKKKGISTFLRKRILFHDISIASNSGQLRLPGEFFLNPVTNTLVVRCANDTMISVNSIQFEGFQVETPELFVKRLRKRCGPTMAAQTTFL